MTFHAMQDRADSRFDDADPLPSSPTGSLSQRPPRIYWIPLILMVIATVLWGLTNVVQKLSLDHMGPFTVIAARCWLGALILLPMALLERRTNAVSRFPVLGRYSIMAALAFCSGLVLQQISAGLTSATNMGFLVNSCAVVVPLILWATGSGRPSAHVMLAAGTVMAGAALLSGSSTNFSIGDLLCLASAFCYAIWTIAVGRAVSGNGAACTLTLFQLVSCAGLSTVVAVIVEAPSLAQLMAFAPGLLYLGVCGTGIAFALSAYAQRSLSICAAAIIMNLEAVFTAIAGHMLMGEVLGGVALVGGAMILAGCVLVQIRQ